MLLFPIGALLRGRLDQMILLLRLHDLLLGVVICHHNKQYQHHTLVALGVHRACLCMST